VKCEIYNDLGLSVTFYPYTNRDPAGRAVGYRACRRTVVTGLSARLEGGSLASRPGWSGVTPRIRHFRAHHGERENHPMAVEGPIWESDVCTRCGGPLRAGNMLLSAREDAKGAGVCKIELLCTACDAIFWRWLDRPEDDLAEFPEDIVQWRRRELATRQRRRDQT